MGSLFRYLCDKSAEDGLCVGCEMPIWMSSHGYPEVCGDSSTPAAFARALEWLSYCVENDQACTQPSNSFVPRRLVNVNLGNEAQDPFLVEPTEPSKCACLSYCWGPDAHDVLRTTKHNIEDHRSGIPINSLPASVRDAVKVCRGLKIPYLWVDSLCILQGHRDEWLHDSSQMDLTYLNSYLTIAALEPASCKSGFLGQQLYGIGGLRPNLREHDESKSVPEPHHSLRSRGWCLQEEMLPIRRLCFDSFEMRWECLCRKMCECGHELWPKADYNFYDEFEISELGTLLKMPTMPVLPPRVTTQYNRPEYTRGRRLNWLRDYYKRYLYSSTISRTHELWRDLISTYSKRTLSDRTDKLAALAGITKMFGNALVREEGSLDEFFLAGLWKKEIHFDLAWHIDRSAAGFSTLPTSQVCLHGGYCAPSWSWACCDMPVKYSFSRALRDWKDTLAAVDKCEFIAAEYVTELTGDWAGPVKRGNIQLRGSLAAVELSMLEAEEGSKETPDTLWLKGEGIVLVQAENLQTAHAIMDNPLDPNIKLDYNTKSCWLEGKCLIGCCLWDENKETQFYCFRLFSWYAPEAAHMGKETWFLLLRKLSNGIYQRIGVGQQIIGRSYKWEVVEESSRYAGWLFENAKEKTIEII